MCGCLRLDVRWTDQKAREGDGRARQEPGNRPDGAEPHALIFGLGVDEQQETREEAGLPASVSNPDMPLTRHLLGLATIVVMAYGCATRGVRPEVALPAAMTAIGHADQRLLEGCLACLSDARDAYARLLDGPAAAVASERRFAAELLIVLREKELSIATGESIGRLRLAAASLSARVDTARVVRLVDMIPPNDAGVPEGEYAAFLHDRLATAEMLDRDVDWLAQSSLWPPARDYLSLSLQCSVLGRPLLSPSHRWRDRGPKPGDSPLLAYRRAVCAGDAGLSSLARLRDATSGLTEIAYTLARHAPMETERASSTVARTLAAEALGDLPQSPAVTYLMASLQQVAGDFQASLMFYDATLALADRHENAQLGRVVSLSYLNQPEEAIAAATTLIDWQSTNLRDGFYWRAFNHHDLERLDLARDDIERSKVAGETLQNRTLAGIIEYEQDDLAIALIDLDRASSLGVGRNCTAAWYRGLVYVKQSAWADAGGAFERSMRCYTLDVADDRLELAAMEARTDVDPALQRAQIEMLTETLQKDERRRWDSAMNAANSLARIGEFARAETLLIVASEDSALSDDVASVRAMIGYGRKVAPAR